MKKQIMETRNLYNIYRPNRFSEVFGQDVIINILKNSIEKGKINHSYLFTGTRGVGKTSLARIFAMRLNCKNVSENDACGECENCIAIKNSNSLDVIEIDAASNNGVDEIRNLHERANYVLDSKYKIFIIDEVHMLSKAAFNAFLKLLEEPPKNVIFILITTEANKIPKTILSRVIILDFQSIDSNTISESLSYIAKKEKIDIQKEAIDMIAFLSNGSIRDSISLMEKIISNLDTNKITHLDVLKLFNLIDSKKLIKIIQSNDLESFYSIVKESKNNIIQFLQYFLKIYTNLIIEINIKPTNVFYPLVEEIIELLLITNEPEMIYSTLIFKLYSKMNLSNNLNLKKESKVELKSNEINRKQIESSKDSANKLKYEEIVSADLMFKIINNLKLQNLEEKEHLFSTRHIFKTDSKYSKYINALKNANFEGLYKNIILITFPNSSEYENFKKITFDKNLFELAKEIFIGDFYFLGLEKDVFLKVKKVLEHKIQKDDQEFLDKIEKTNDDFFNKIVSKNSDDDISKLSKILGTKVKVK